MNYLDALRQNPVDLGFRAIVAAIGIGAIGVGFLAKGEFRWGRRGQGPRMEPQWVGRLFFAFIGSVMLYVAITGFK
jgi:hypothetical protein